MLTSAAGAAAGTRRPAPLGPRVRGRAGALVGAAPRSGGAAPTVRRPWPRRDRKSTRLNSSHGSISYAVFCLKKKKETSLSQGRRAGGEALPYWPRYHVEPPCAVFFF